MISSRLALRLAGLQVNSSLRAGNPDKAHRAACGGCAEVRERRGFLPVALRLAGLQVHRCLRAGSLDKAHRAACGECAELRERHDFFPVALR